jgi:hypothetical protein
LTEEKAKLEENEWVRKGLREVDRPRKRERASQAKVADEHGDKTKKMATVYS